MLSSMEHTQRAMLQSQSGPAAGRWITAVLWPPAKTMSDLRMHVVLRRRVCWLFSLNSIAATAGPVVDTEMLWATG